jgi:hypothetical protein
MELADGLGMGGRVGMKTAEPGELVGVFRDVG